MAIVDKMRVEYENRKRKVSKKLHYTYCNLPM